MQFHKEFKIGLRVRHKVIKFIPVCSFPCRLDNLFRHFDPRGCGMVDVEGTNHDRLCRETSGAETFILVSEEGALASS